MKKAISLLVALTFVFTMGVAAFAADDIPGVNTRMDGMADMEPTVGFSPFIADTAAGAMVGAGELYLVDANENYVGGVYNLLEPNTEYTFDIYINATTDAVNVTEKDSDNKLVHTRTPLTGAELKDGTIRLRTLKGSSAVTSARIKTIGRNETARYQMIVSTRPNYSTKVTEVEFGLNVTGNDDINNSTHTFEVGYNTIRDEDTDIGEGGYITISNDYPIITREQFVTIAKSVNYKTVNFEAEDGGWLFTGRVSGMNDSNFTYSYDVIPEIVSKLPDQEYKFLTFNAGVTFPASGEMRIDVSDIYDAYEGKLYAYLYRNGKLTAIDHTYDNGTNEIVFRTNYLGSFVITDKAVTDLNLIGEPEEPEEPELPELPGEGGNEGPGSGNPNTGAASAMNIAITLGLASLVSAKAVSKKRK